MISRQHKYIFVHCQKCGGESVELALAGRVDVGYGGDPFEGGPERHFPAKQYISKYGQDMWDEYFTFSFVRNPWDRVISWIRYRDIRWKLYGGKLDSDIIKKEVVGFVRHSYKSFLFNGDTLLPKFVGKLENFQEDFNIVCDKIGIPQRELPHENKTKHKHYTEYYDGETREIVAKQFKEDIEIFGYEFGK